MKFKFTKENLETPLHRLSMIASKTEGMLSTLLVESSGTDVSLTATDLARQIRFNLAGGTVEEGRITLPARKFASIVQTLPIGASVEVEKAKDGGFTRIKSGKSRFKLHGLDPDEFPALDAMDEKTERVSISVQNLRLLLKGVAPSMAKDDVRTYLCGCLFEPRKGQLQVVATNGHRLAKCAIEAPCQSLPSRNFIVPRDAIVDLLGLLSTEKDEEQLVDLQFGERHFGVSIGSYRLLTGLLDGHYPNYASIIPDPGERRVRIDTSDAIGALNRVTLLLEHDGAKRFVKLSFSGEDLHISARNSLQENAEERISANIFGEKGEINFNPDYLRDILQVSRTGVMDLFIQDENSSVRIEESSAIEGWASTYVVMPVML
mgnify:CR=1 FL=1